MSHAKGSSKQVRLIARLGVVVGVLLALALFLAASASAAYEQVGIFAGSLTPPIEPGVFPEEVQLGGVGGMAVNINGTGGVPPGTVYASTYFGGQSHVARFEPESDGKLKFVESWAVSPNGGPYERCGPVLDVSCSARPMAETRGVDIDIDQATGNVYVYTEGTSSGSLRITVYTPDGSKEITRLGELAIEGEPTSASPEKIHHATYPGAIAVNNAGDVYVFDENPQDHFYHRLMEFEPQKPGDYEHYVYAGTSHDVDAGFFGETKFPFRPVMDSAGHIYVTDTEWVEEYDPSQPASPICRFLEHKGDITAITVDPSSGEVFFYSYRDKEIHRLSACSSEHTFVVLESIKVSPERGNLEALAFDPNRRFEPSRLPGVLYGATPEAVPNVGGKGEPGQSSLGYIFASAHEDPPAVKSESVVGVSDTTAELHASIDPMGSETRYVFQYLTSAAYEENGESFTGAAEAPVGGAVIGGGQGALSAAVAVSGLAPDTAYRYRVIATSKCSSKEPEKVCKGIGAVQEFSTFPVESAGLPDGRGYELVSPVDKYGGEVFPAEPNTNSCKNVECKPGITVQHFPMQSSPDGEAVVYEGSPFSLNEGSVLENEYISRRTPSGWRATDLAPSLLQRGTDEGFDAFDASLSEGLIEAISPSLTPGAPSGYDDLYSQSTGDPSQLGPVVSDTPLNHTPFNSTPKSFQLSYAGASADLSRVFFFANDALTPEATGGAEEKINLYEWAGGQLRAVNLTPGSTETTPGAAFGVQGTVSHAISDDGSRVFWSTEPSGQVYVRENGERTVEIPDHTGRFVTAAADGSTVLLSDGHIYGHLEEEQPTLEGDLTNGKGGFQGILGQSEDLSHVYFVDTEVLSEEPNERGAKAQTGGDNLYAWNDGGPVFVATLLATDNERLLGVPHSLTDWAVSPSNRSAEASPDGRWLAFLSSASLTGYENTGPCEVISGTSKFLQAPCNEAFVYDSGTGKLRCASCDPSGATPIGQTSLTLIRGVGIAVPQPRYLTDSGRLFFDSQNSLLPADTNRGVEDVYEFEPEGVGTCARSNGCVALISAGSGKDDSNFLTMDASAKNVFFTTRDRLVPADKDEAIDLYDAREGGGIARESELESDGCHGETCQPSNVPPGESSPASLLFTGPGNLPLMGPFDVAASPKPKAKAKVLTRAQVLTKALKACKGKPRKKRVACERVARGKYGAKASAKRSVSERKGGK